MSDQQLPRKEQEMPVQRTDDPPTFTSASHILRDESVELEHVEDVGSANDDGVDRIDWTSVDRSLLRHQSGGCGPETDTNQPRVYGDYNQGGSGDVTPTGRALSPVRTGSIDKGTLTESQDTPSNLEECYRAREKNVADRETQLREILLRLRKILKDLEELIDKVEPLLTEASNGCAQTTVSTFTLSDIPAFIKAVLEHKIFFTKRGIFLVCILYWLTQNIFVVLGLVLVCAAPSAITNARRRTQTKKP